MKKSNFQIAITILIPFIVSVVGGGTVLWDTFSKYNHVLSKGVLLILIITLFILPFIVDFYLSKKPLNWIFNGTTKGKLKTIKPYGYILSWFFCAVFYIYLLTYGPYKGISKSEEDATISLVKKLKEKPFFLTGFFLRSNEFIDSSWHLTRESDAYYQGQTYPEDPFTFVNDFYITKDIRHFFTSNVQVETVTISDLDTISENEKSYIKFKAHRIDSEDLKDISFDPDKYDVYFTENFVNHFNLSDMVNDINLPMPFRKFMEKFEKIKETNSFSYISRKNRNFIVVSDVLDTFNRGSSDVSIKRMSLVSYENLDTFFLFSQIMVDLYNETKMFLKARNILLELDKIQFTNYLRQMIRTQNAKE